MAQDLQQEQPHFPDYGEAGDRSGARRTRRAFRLCVVSVVVLTGMLWVAERFLRYDHAESLYLSALTLPRESSRVMLQQAIRTERQAGKPPAAKYLQVLAVREEEDVALDVFAEAMALDPDDSLFALRYGARLFRTDPAKAAELFRTAGSQRPNNGLAAYLEAAAIAQAAGTEASIQEAMVIVARTNNGGAPIVYPKPLWFAPSVLPQDGVRYAELSREIVREVTAPLYAFGQQVTRAAVKQVEDERLQNTKIWLEQLRVMGERLARDCEPRGVGQVNAGIFLQRLAVEKLRDIASMEGAELQEALVEYHVRLGEASDLLASFEESRQLRLEADREEYSRPLFTFELGLAVVFSAYLIVFVGYRVSMRRKTLWTLPHSTLANAVWASAFVLLLAIAHLHTIFQSVAGDQNDILRAVNTVWWTALATVLLFGFFYPTLTLKRVDEVCRATGRPEEMSELIPRARRAYRRAYSSYVMRYFGVWLGLYICLVCAWALSYRIITGLYPWQILLLSTGLLEEERAIATQAIALLK